jgi:hypothetical protein
LIYTNHSSQYPFREKVFLPGLNTYPSGSNGQQRDIQKSFVTSTLEIPQWNFNLLILIPFHHISVATSLFVTTVLDKKLTLTGVVQKSGSVNVY